MNCILHCYLIQDTLLFIHFNFRIQPVETTGSKSVKKSKEKRKDIEYCHACRYSNVLNAATTAGNVLNAALPAVTVVC